MLSTQCDELRAMAESVGLAMPQAATLMMEAADTIDSLDLALDSKRIAERRVTELLDENAKLRELARAAWRCIHTGASCSDCRLIAGGCTLQTAMRELRVEVDG